MGGGNVSHFINRKGQGVSVIKLLEATVTADEEPYEVYKPAARWQEAKEGGGDQSSIFGDSSVWLLRTKWIVSLFELESITGLL